MKERKESKNRYVKLNRRRWRFMYIKDELQGEKNSRKGKQRNKCRKNIKGLKKIKVKIIKKREEERSERRKKKGKLHRTAKAQCRCRGL